MEFSFKAYQFLADIEANRHYMVLWAAFGVPLFMLALTLPFYILRKLGLYNFMKPFYSVIYLSLGISWILGFITLMVLYFSEVSGIRMFLIWGLMFLTYFVFCIFNRNMLNQWIDEISKSNSMMNKDGSSS